MFRIGHFLRALTAVVATSLIVACGGGGDSASPDASAPASSTASSTAAGATAGSATAGEARTKAALAASVTQFGGDGWYWDPLQSGTGFMFEAQGNRGFVAFFMYEEVTLKPIWYAAYGEFIASEDGTYAFAGDLRYYSQGQAVTNPVYQPQLGISRLIGQVSIRFNGHNATVQLPGGRTIAGTRFDIAQSGFNFSNPTPRKAFQPEVGWYWNPEEGGRGYAIEVQNDRVFMAMFHYNEDGSPTWNIFDTDISTGVARGQFQRLENGQTLTSPHRYPQSLVSRGQMTMSFRSACAGQLQFEGMKAIQIRRFVVDGSPLAYGAECNSPSPNWFQTVRFLLIQPGDLVFGTTGNPQPGYDQFRIALVAGRSYVIDLKGASSGAGTLADPVLEVEYLGTVVASNDNRAAGTTDSRITFTPSVTSGLYYIRAKAKSPDTGSFLLSVSGVGSDLVADPTPLLATYVGTFQGRYSGQRNGSLSLSITSTGSVSGTATTDNSAPEPVTGRVELGGLISVSTAGASPLQFRAFLSPSGPMTGSWSAQDGSAGSILVTRSDNPLTRLYGQLNLSYSFTGSSNVYTEQTTFAAANLTSSAGTFLFNYVTGSQSRAVTCTAIDAKASVTSYICLAKFDFSESSDIFLFNVSLGQVVNGRYEYCLAGTNATSCGAELVTSPDGVVTGSISQPGAGTDKGVARFDVAVDHMQIESAKAIDQAAQARTEGLATSADGPTVDQVVKGIEVLRGQLESRTATQR